MIAHDAIRRFFAANRERDRLRKWERLSVLGTYIVGSTLGVRIAEAVKHNGGWLAVWLLAPLTLLWLATWIYVGEKRNRIYREMTEEAEAAA